MGPQGGREAESQRGGGAKAEQVIVGWEEGTVNEKVRDLGCAWKQQGRQEATCTAHTHSAVTAEAREGFWLEPLLLIHLSFRSAPVPSPSFLCQMGEMQPPDRMSGDSESPVWHETGCP